MECEGVRERGMSEPGEDGKCRNPAGAGGAGGVSRNHVTRHGSARYTPANFNESPVQSAGPASPLRASRSPLTVPSQARSRPSEPQDPSPRSRPSEVCPGAGRPRRVLGHQFVDPADEVVLLDTALAHLAPVIQDPPQLLDAQLAQVDGAQVDLFICGESRAALRHAR